MKSTIVLAIALFFFSGVSGQDTGTVDSSFANSHYRHRLAFFKQMPDGKKEIVFLGNSITEGGEWQELSGRKNVINRGISGDVTYGVLARLDEVLSSKPQRIFLLIGINDMKRGIPPDTIAKTYARIVETIRRISPKTKLFLQSVLPVNESMLGAPYKKLTNESIRRLNVHIRSIAASSGTTYVDLHPVLADEKGALKSEYTQDGIHLWPDAYIHWVELLRGKKLL